MLRDTGPQDDKPAVSEGQATDAVAEIAPWGSAGTASFVPAASALLAQFFTATSNSRGLSGESSAAARRREKSGTGAQHAASAGDPSHALHPVETISLTASAQLAAAVTPTVIEDGAERVGEGVNASAAANHLTAIDSGWNAMALSENSDAAPVNQKQTASSAQTPAIAAPAPSLPSELAFAARLRDASGQDATVPLRTEVAAKAADAPADAADVQSLPAALSAGPVAGQDAIAPVRADVAPKGAPTPEVVVLGSRTFAAQPPASAAGPEPRPEAAVSAEPRGFVAATPVHPGEIEATAAQIASGAHASAAAVRSFAGREAGQTISGLPPQIGTEAPGSASDTAARSSGLNIESAESGPNLGGRGGATDASRMESAPETAAATPAVAQRAASDFGGADSPSEEHQSGDDVAASPVTARRTAAGTAKASGESSSEFTAGNGVAWDSARGAPVTPGPRLVDATRSGASTRISEPSDPDAAAPAGQPVRDLSIRLSDGGSRTADVRITERGGEVRVAVRSNDTDLTASLRSDLNDLTARIDRHGVSAEFWHPASAPAQAGTETSSRNQDNGQGANQHAREGEPNANGNGGQQSNRRRTPTPDWLEEFESSTRNSSQRNENLWQR